MKRTVPFFLGITYVGAALSELLSHIITHIFVNLTTFLLECLCVFFEMEMVQHDMVEKHIIIPISSFIS